MNFYSTELRTPPLPLVAFIQHSELHKDIGAYFSQTLRPPLVSVGVVEANEQLLVRLFSPRKPFVPPSNPPEGILKADWFLKQRQRRPAVALALISREELEGDPIAWQRVLGQLRVIKDAASQRGAGVLVLVIHNGPINSELPADRIAGICHNLALDPTAFCSISRDWLGSADGRARNDAELKQLGQRTLEMAWSYYGREAERIGQKQARLQQQLGEVPAECRVSASFKLAVLAEFRQDWTGAVGRYQEAYTQLKEVAAAVGTALQAGPAAAVPYMTPGGAGAVQRHAEVCRVAEVVHFKVCTLLLHQQRFVEALQQLRDHLATYATPPAGLSPAAACSHLGWLCRQHTVAAEMIRARPLDEALMALHRECQPHMLLMAAAQVAVRRRQLADELRAGGRQPAGTDLSAVRKGPHIGQLVARTDSGLVRLSDAEYAVALEAEEVRTALPAAALEVLTAAAAAAREPRHERLRTQLAALQAGEHLAGNGLVAARKLLLQVAHAYRRDGWDGPLLRCLLDLKTCAQRLKQPKELLAASLELAALQARQPGVPPASREALLKAVRICCHSLVTGTSDLKAGIMKGGGSGRATPEAEEGGAAAPPPPAGGSGSLRFDYILEHLDLTKRLWEEQQAQQQQQQQQQAGQQVTQQAAGQQQGEQQQQGAAAADLLSRHHQQDAGWATCVSLAAGFQRVTQPCPKAVTLVVVLRNNLPAPLPLQRLELRLLDDGGKWGAIAQQGPPPAPGSAPQQAALQQQEQQQQQQGEEGDAAGGSVAATASSSSKSSSSSSLAPGCWQTFHLTLSPRRAGRLALDEAVLHISPHSSVTWRLATFPPQLATIGSTSTLPTSTPTSTTSSTSSPGSSSSLEALRPSWDVIPGVYQLQLQQVGPQPQLELQPPDVCLAGGYAAVRCRLDTNGGSVSGAALELSLRNGEEHPALLAGSSHRRSSTSESVSAGGSSSGAASSAGFKVRLPATGGALQDVAVDGCRLPLPNFSDSSPLEVDLYVMRATPGPTVLSVVVAMAGGVAGAAPGWQPQQQLELQFERPFDHSIRLCSESGVHTLTIPSRAYKSGGSAAVPLAIGQPVAALATVRSLHQCELQVTDMQVEVDESAGLQLLTDLQQQLAGPTSSARGLLLGGPGAAATAICQICPISLLPAPVSMGRLLLRWRRAATSGGPALDDVPEGSTSLPLPQVLVQNSILSVHLVAPPQATTGIQFPLTLQIKNLSSSPQEVTLNVADAQGLLFHGQRQGSASVPPQDTSSLSWGLVAHLQGHLQLPVVRVSAPRYGCSVVLQGGRVHVMPF